MGDAELLRAARRDPEAFSRFYERQAVPLRARLRRQTGSREVANDLAAETLAQALVSLRRFRGHRPQTIPLDAGGGFTWTRPAGTAKPSLISVSVLDERGRRLAEAQPYPESVWRRWLEQARG